MGKYKSIVVDRSPGEDPEATFKEVMETMAVALVIIVEDHPDLLETVMERKAAAHARAKDHGPETYFEGSEEEKEETLFNKLCQIFVAAGTDYLEKMKREKEAFEDARPTN